MKLKEYLDEAAYKNNLGFEEMVKLYQNANDKQIKKIEKAIKKEDWSAYKKLVKEILNVDLI